MSFLHQIFYGNNKFDITEETIADLNKWAEYIRVHKPANDVSPNHAPTNDVSIKDTAHFQDENRDINIEPVTVEQPSHITLDNVSKPNPKTSYNQPKLSKPIVKHSSLFWCMFIAQYGYSEYLRVGTRFQNRELEEKQTMMEILSKDAKQLKDGNIRLTNDAVQEILSGLMFSSKEDFSSLVAYSKYYKKTIYVVFSCSYLVFSYTKDYLSQDLNNTCVIYQTRKHPKYGGSYSLEFDLTLEKLQTIRDTKIAMEHYEKPFRGISAYKMADLTAMASKIGILDAMKKTELYAKIVEKCCEGIQS